MVQQAEPSIFGPLEASIVRTGDHAFTCELRSIEGVPPAHGIDTFARRAFARAVDAAR